MYKTNEVELNTVGDSKQFATRMILSQGELYPWFEFTPASCQTYFFVYMFNLGEISPLPLLCPYLQDRGKTNPGVIRHDFNVLRWILFHPVLINIFYGD